jgi:plastocyanin
MKRSSSLVLTGVFVAILVVAAAGCGGGSSSSSESTTTEAAGGTSGTTLTLAADPTGKLAFDKSKLTAPAGQVTIVMTNDSSVDHDIAIEGNGVRQTGAVVNDGQTSTVTADLKPGTYTFYCSVDGHREVGMEGTLVVK